MIQMIPLKCPSCGAKMEVSEGKEEYFCSYCGEKILIHDTTRKTVKKIYRDETKIAESENETLVRLEEIRAKAADDKRTMIFVIIIVIITFLFPLISIILH